MAITDLIGLLGVAVYMVAYFCVQVLRHPPSSHLVTSLNLIGPVCLLISLSQDFNLASALSQAFWFLLTVVGWWRRDRPGSAGRPEAAPTAQPRP
ncbi:CBU_0592 family membrane protein [Ideonella livida]|uniref:CBU-0592-like domain-containing protein n=1 Tax=Ideonella livida TaxID=2707176 RepID=A0A7C9TL24_9BURK|nr:hypothetical protein [Ideonella livida]NDY93239.1 hypothetical protein [Ideonella livida]